MTNEIPKYNRDERGIETHQRLGVCNRGELLAKAQQSRDAFIPQFTVER